MARIFQDTRQKERLGKDCPWSVEWTEGGKRRSVKVGGKMEAKERAKQIDARLLDRRTGLREVKPWSEFRDWYSTTILPAKKEVSRAESARCLAMFEKLVQPSTMDDIHESSLDDYVAKRQVMPGKKPGSLIAGQSLAKECRHIRAILKKAKGKRWQLEQVPDMPRDFAPGSPKRYVPWDDFNRIWHACGVATMPKEFPSPANWWRALLMVFWVSGVRVGSLLQAEWENADLAKGIIMLPATTTKQKKSHVIQIHQAIDNLAAIRPEAATGPIFPWPHHRRTLDEQWDAIQVAAGVKLPCVIDRPHT